MEPLTPQDIAPEGGLRVVLLSDHSSIGVVLKRAGPRVRVDFSPSGGPNSKWVLAQDLCRTALPEGSDIAQLGVVLGRSGDSVRGDFSQSGGPSKCATAAELCRAAEVCTPSGTPPPLGGSGDGGTSGREHVMPSANLAVGQRMGIGDGAEAQTGGARAAEVGLPSRDPATPQSPPPAADRSRRTSGDSRILDPGVDVAATPQQTRERRERDSGELFGVAREEEGERSISQQLLKFTVAGPNPRYGTTCLRKLMETLQQQANNSKDPRWPNSLPVNLAEHLDSGRRPDERHDMSGHTSQRVGVRVYNLTSAELTWFFRSQEDLQHKVEAGLNPFESPAGRNGATTTPEEVIVIRVEGYDSTEYTVTSQQSQHIFINTAEAVEDFKKRQEATPPRIHQSSPASTPLRSPESPQDQAAKMTNLSSIESRTEASSQGIVPVFFAAPNGWTKDKVHLQIGDFEWTMQRIQPKDNQVYYCEVDMQDWPRHGGKLASYQFTGQMSAGWWGSRRVETEPFAGPIPSQSCIFKGKEASSLGRILSTIQHSLSRGGDHRIETLGDALALVQDVHTAFDVGHMELYHMKQLVATVETMLRKAASPKSRFLVNAMLLLLPDRKGIQVSHAAQSCLKDYPQHSSKFDMTLNRTLARRLFQYVDGHPPMRTDDPYKLNHVDALKLTAMLKIALEPHDGEKQSLQQSTVTGII